MTKATSRVCFVLMCLFCFGLMASCTTRYSSATDESGGTKIIIGDEDVIFHIIRRAVKDEFDSDTIISNPDDREISWSHKVLTKTDFRLILEKVTAMDSTGTAVVGFYYTVKGT